MGCSLVTLSLLANLVVLASSFILEAGPRRVNKILSVSNGGVWGTWRDAEFCPSGAFATGYKLRIEPALGTDSDDTSLNAIELHCGFLELEGYGGDITSGQSPWGNWGTDYKCNKHDGTSDFLTSFVLQVEATRPEIRDFDDTAANYVRFKCRDFHGSNPEYELSSGKGLWGTFGSWSQSCPANTAICGLRTKIEAPDGDDTALNDVQFYCCSY